MARLKESGFILLLTLPWTLLIPLSPSPTMAPQVLDRDYWYAQAEKDLARRLQLHGDKKPKAKSVIMFIGDGMSLATVTAARELRAQRTKTGGNGGLETTASGEAAGLIWDHFPAAALAQTYNLNAQTGESSACATALLCGVKANYETLGLDGTARFENCSSSFSSRVSSVLEWAQQAGKSTGFVTTTRVTHATPGALFAHSPSRYWEDDSKVPPASRKSCKDIALQLVDNEPGKNINVILGGGRRHWLPTVTRDPEQPSAEGRRLDGRNLIDDWLRDKKRRRLRAEYVWNKEQFDNVNTDKVDYLLGLFDYSHMSFAADQPPGPAGDPSLLDMTMIALSILEKNPKGFFLMVEGGRIDHAHHYNNPYRALDETLQLEAAVRAALSRADLLLVTADHGHVMTVGGHGAPRDHPILGSDVKTSDIDGLPYSTVLYGSGPGHGARIGDPSLAEPGPAEMGQDMNRVHAAAAPRQWATHGAEDVPVYAIGPLATVLFSGTFEQSYIPHAVAYIACLGDQAARCDEPDNYTQPQMAATCPESELGRSAPGGSRGGVASTGSAGTSGRLGIPGVVVVASSVMSDDAAPRSHSSPVHHLGSLLTLLIKTCCLLTLVSQCAFTF
ncbi:alkaline phosphatase-like [Arctopsyche grandis]|uniref:alkaline phosphatase-like n=1 Tax=Arctopsyche grandis TaxID=121162 RepID=UPI00406D8724